MIGPRVVEYLQVQLANPGEDRYSQFNRSLAQVCLGLLAPDADGLPILHYLGEGFINFVSRGQHQDLYARALTYVTQQAAQFRAKGESKLAFRYSQLELYFHAHSPEDAEAQQTHPPDQQQPASPPVAGR